MMQTEIKIIEDENGQLICQAHQQSIIFYSQNHFDNVEDRLQCQQCVEKQEQKQQLHTLDNIFNQIKNDREQAEQSFNKLQLNTIQFLGFLNSQIVELEKQIIAQIQQVQNQCKEWTLKIKEKQLDNLYSLTKLQKLKKYSNNYIFEQQQEIEKEIQQLNINQYQEIYKQLSQLSISSWVEPIQKTLTTMFNKDNQQNQQVQNLQIKPLQQSQNDNPYLEILCQTHNLKIQHIDLQNNEQQIDRLKCSKCKIGKAIQVADFFGLYSEYYNNKINIVNEKKKVYTDKIIQISDYYNEIKKTVLEKINQFTQELDFTFVKEINFENINQLKNVNKIEKEDILKMIEQILIFHQKKSSEEENNLQGRINRFNEITIQQSKEINELFINQRQQLVNIINLSNSELKKSIFKFQQYQEQIINSLNEINSNDLQEQQREDQIISSLQKVERELSSQISSQIKFVSQNIIKLQKEFINKFKYTLINDDQIIDNRFYTNCSPYAIGFNNIGDKLICSFKNYLHIRNFENGKLSQVNQTISTDHTGQSQNFFSFLENYTYAIVFSKNQKWFFAGTSNIISLYINQVDSWSKVDCSNRDQCHSGVIRCLLLNKQETQLYSCSEDSTIKSWKIDYHTSFIQIEQTFQKMHTKSIWCIVMNDCENQIVSAGDDKKIIVWQKNNQNKWEYKYPIDNNNQYTGIRIAFINDNLFALTVKEKGIIYFFNLQNEQCKEYQRLDLTYDLKEQDFCFKLIYLKKQQVLICKHNKYVYFLKQSHISEKYQIVCEPINCESYYTYGTTTPDGEYLALQSNIDGKIKIYKLDCY